MKKIECRDIIRDFFSPLKAESNYIRFLFITGISVFIPQGFVSGLNCLYHISNNFEFNAICGFTKNEILGNLKSEIGVLAKANDETYEQACDHLKTMYGGYKFSENGEEIYNPFSVISALNSKKYESYWFQKGEPEDIINQMRRHNEKISEIKDFFLSKEDFNSPSEFEFNPIAELYQKGYLSIKGYDSFSKLYKLDFPNLEVEAGFQSILS